MTGKNTYKVGTPIWTDLESPDLDASAEFYNKLFGWDCDRGPAEYGGYSMLRNGDNVVSGLGPLGPGGEPTQWNLYFATDSIEETAKLAIENGGTKVMEPMDIPGAGRMSFLRSPGGASFGIWQPKEHTGADAWGENHTAGWVELNTRDTAASADFYAKVFNWTAKPSEGYTEFAAAGAELHHGGMLDMNAVEIPKEVPEHWVIYFMVDDVDKSSEHVKEIGGTVHVPPMDIPGGALRFSLVRDNHGASFGLLKV